jgi:hypothetical protein
MEKCIRSLCSVILLTALSLSACNMPSQSQGPTIWIDQPLDGSHHPLSSLIIQAHASDADGVDKIQFFIANDMLTEVPASGQRLGQASFEWTPPAAGRYTIRAKAIDSKGHVGAEAMSAINVGELGESPTGPTPSVTHPMPGMTETPLPAAIQCTAEALVAPLLLSPADNAVVESEPLFAWTYPDETCHPYSYKIDISEQASFSEVSLGFGTHDYNETSRQWPLPPGKCYYWRVLAYVPDVDGPASTPWRFCLGETATPAPMVIKWVSKMNTNCHSGPGTAYGTIDVLMSGQEAPIKGKNSEGTWILVQRPDNASSCWVSQVTGEVVGNLDAVPIIVVPTLSPTPTAAPPKTKTPKKADLTPPHISGVSIKPDSIQKKGCGAPDELTISATVIDPSGVGAVIYKMRGPGSSDTASGNLSHVTGDLYQAMVGPIAGSTGTWSISLQARDTAQNVAEAGPWSIHIVCIQ